jgi:hypothetical protein
MCRKKKPLFFDDLKKCEIIQKNVKLYKKMYIIF